MNLLVVKLLVFLFSVFQFSYLRLSTLLSILITVFLSLLTVSSSPLFFSSFPSSFSSSCLLLAYSSSLFISFMPYSFPLQDMGYSTSFCSWLLTPPPSQSLILAFLEDCQGVQFHYTEWVRRGRSIKVSLLDDLSFRSPGLFCCST